MAGLLKRCLAPPRSYPLWLLESTGPLENSTHTFLLLLLLLLPLPLLNRTYGDGGGDNAELLP